MVQVEIIDEEQLTKTNKGLNKYLSHNVPPVMQSRKMGAATRVTKQQSKENNEKFKVFLNKNKKKRP